MRRKGAVRTWERRLRFSRWATASLMFFVLKPQPVASSLKRMPRPGQARRSAYPSRWGILQVPAGTEARVRVVLVPVRPAGAHPRARGADRKKSGVPQVASGLMIPPTDPARQCPEASRQQPATRPHALQRSAPTMQEHRNCLGSVASPKSARRSIHLLRESILAALFTVGEHALRTAIGFPGQCNRCASDGSARRQLA